LTLHDEGQIEIQRGIQR